MRILNERMATEKTTQDIISYITDKINEWLKKHSEKLKSWQITLMVDLCFRKIADKKYDHKPSVKGYVFRMEDVDYDEDHGYYAILSDNPMSVVKERLTDKVISDAFEYASETEDLNFDKAVSFEHLVCFSDFSKLDEAKDSKASKVYTAVYNVENGSGHSVRDWKIYIDGAKIPGVKVTTGDSSYKHNKTVRIEAPNRDAAKKVIKALRKYGIKWPEADAFKNLSESAINEQKIEFDKAEQPKGGMHQSVIDEETAKYFIGVIAEKLKEYEQKDKQEWSLNDFKMIEFLRDYFVYEMPFKFCSSKLRVEK